MAFVPITAGSITMRGRSGRIYNLPFTKATAVGMVTFTQDAQTFWVLPEDAMIIDAYVGDAVNAADYLDVYLDGVVKIQMRIYADAVNNATTIPRTAPSSWIKGGTQFAMYFYSA